MTRKRNQNELTVFALGAAAMMALWLAGVTRVLAADPPTGATYTNSLGMGLVRFEPGTFTMGVGTDLRIVDTNSLDYDEQSAHSVTLTAPFYVLTGRVTQAQFALAGLGAAPVDGRVSWDRGAAFCAWLSQQDGLTYRLPTEAEWEYVRRTPGSVGDFGSEWVADWHGSYRNLSLTNPAGPAAGVLKVIRSDAINRLGRPPVGEGEGMFRVVLDTASTNRFVYSPLPFNQMGVKQSAAPALQGPLTNVPYFTVRFAMPIPQDNDRQFNAALVGLDPAVVDHNHSPGFEVMPNGDALAIYFSGGNGTEYGSKIRIVQARLRYGAEEFDMPELLFQMKDQDIAPLLWREGTTNWLFTGWTNNPSPFRISKSLDNGATWTMDIPRPTFPANTVSPQPINSAFRAPNGSMYMTTDAGPGLLQSVLWRSQDNGVTWNDQGGRTAARHSTIVPLDGTGRLLCVSGKNVNFNSSGYMPWEISTDCGVTWQAETQSPFPQLAMNQRPSLYRLANGKLIMVGDAAVSNPIGTGAPAGWTHGAGPYVALSADNGTSWHFKALPVALKHEDRPHLTLGYTTVRQAPNGVIHVLATMTQPCLHYEFNEAWVYSAEGDITPETGGGSIQSYSENYLGGAIKATWSARICPNGRYLLDGVETNYNESGIAQRVVTWASGRRTGEETVWASNGEKVWSWNHDPTNNVSTWTHWWSNGRKRLESQWDTYPAARDLPSRHFRGLVANGTARIWDSTGRDVASCLFANGALASMSLPEAPTITTQPANVMVYASQTATFSVTASGTPPLFYQWYTNNAAIGGATGTTYTTPATTTNESGTQFKVTVTNAYGAVTSSVATLTVLEMPQYPPSATGGTLMNYTLNSTNYWAHLFMNTGSAVFTPSQALTNVEYLIVGGGGSAGSNGGGGGGAGGARTGTVDLSTTSYPIVVGGGATQVVVSGQWRGTNGGDSSVFGTTAAGGGGGASRDGGGAGYSSAGGSGGGGGGGASPQLTKGSATGGYGNDGGAGYESGASSAGGGGGGYVSAGTAGASKQGGNGGNGYWSAISGVYTGYCGGGAGSGLDYSIYGGKAGTVQAGAGGGGPQNGLRDGRPNSGGGGGGLGTGLNSGDSGGGSGGSGIVVIRYAVDSSSATSTYTVVYNGNGEDSGTAPAIQIKTQNVAVVVSGNTGNLARISYTFSGWNTASNGTGSGYAPGASYTASADVILYARWVSNTPPAITTGPAPATVTAGQAATFSVTASGSPTLLYQWYTNNAAIGGAKASSYTTPATTTNDSGAAFKVIVTNAYGAVTSAVATLTVNAVPAGTVVAAGGTVTNYTLNNTNWTAHIFTTVGVTNLNVTAGGNVEVMVVGGGGGGGQADNGPGGAGGGGGAGGLILTNFTVLFGSNYAVTVGDGGPANTAANGGNSLFGSLTALGGGYGGRMVNLLATNGGSGGGGFGRGALPTNAAGTATQPGSSSGGYGSNGGAGGAGTAANGGGGGGGGGAGSAGAAGNVNTTGGNGGAGFTNSISGIETVYAGGGGGGSGESGYAAGSATGGGGAGGGYGTHGANASPNTGGGGGGSAVSSGAQFYGGKGGSGIVIVRYVTGALDPFEAWRQTSFTAAQLTNAAISSATADPDGDGLNNEQEYLAGTNPTNALSCLAISAATNNPSTSGKFVVSWQSVSSKMYKVMATTNLLTGFTDLATNIQATPTMNVYTDSVGSAETKFYRVKLE